eukprot:gene27872-39816_t
MEQPAGGWLRKEQYAEVEEKVRSGLDELKAGQMKKQEGRPRKKGRIAEFRQRITMTERDRQQEKKKAKKEKEEGDGDGADDDEEEEKEKREKE